MAEIYLCEGHEYKIHQSRQESGDTHIWVTLNGKKISRSYVVPKQSETSSLEKKTEPLVEIMIDIVKQDIRENILYEPRKK